MNEENNVEVPPVIVETPPVIQETHEQLPRRWPLLLLYAAMAFVVALIVVFGGRAIYRHNHHAAVKTVPTGTVKRPSSQPASNSSNNSKDNNKTDTNTGTASNSSSTSTSLPNSGPGQVFGLFIGSAVAAAGLHYLINLRRGAKNY